MRGFGDSEPAPIDATRGLRDWADDTYALVRALGIDGPIHIGGWSTGGAAAAHFAMDHPVASLTLIDTVSPYGFGGTRADGTPCWPDYAGSGGGVASSDFVQRLRRGDRVRGTTSPRSVMTSSYWSPSHSEPREEELLSTSCSSASIGDDFYPGDVTPSENWPGVAPGTRGIINALSPRYCDWSGLDLTRSRRSCGLTGSDDVVISDLRLGTGNARPGRARPRLARRGRLSAAADGRADGAAVLERLRNVRVERFEGSGHFPPIDAAERWSQVFSAFLGDAEHDRHVPTAKRWRNHTGNQSIEPLRIYRPATLDEVREIVRTAERDGATVRAVGSGTRGRTSRSPRATWLRPDRLNAPLEVSTTADAGASRPGCASAISTGSSTATGSRCRRWAATTRRPWPA